jgi:hypothetical protein
MRGVAHGTILAMPIASHMSIRWSILAVAGLTGAVPACSDASGAAGSVVASDASPEAAADASSAGDAGDAGAGLHVEGRALVDHGTVVRLLGVNHRGTESGCLGDAGIFDGPSDATLGAAILRWKANAVRLPLNEDCVLGINGLSSSFAGTAYNEHVAALVKLLRSQGLYVILSLSRAAPGTVIASDAPPMADFSHAAEFWSVVASTFHGTEGVVFDLYGAPSVDPSDAVTKDPWACWFRGCTMGQADAMATMWQSAGMQDLVDAVRSVGATNVLLAAGLDSGNDLSGWLAHAPHDPLANLAAAFQVYDTSACGDVACWSSTVAAVAAKVPVVATEVGERDCAHGMLDTFLSWADGAGVSYLGSSWNTGDCATTPSLITDYGGTPTPFGDGLRMHLAAVAPH